MFIEFEIYIYTSVVITIFKVKAGILLLEKYCKYIYKTSIVIVIFKIKAGISLLEKYCDYL